MFRTMNLMTSMRTEIRGPAAAEPSVDFVVVDVETACSRVCLRHPLPAVVFADSVPTAAVIQVDDTATALGFDLPMFLNVAGRQQFGDDTVILTGYFFIPVPDVTTSPLSSSRRMIRTNASGIVVAEAFGIASTSSIRSAAQTGRVSP